MKKENLKETKQYQAAVKIGKTRSAILTGKVSQSILETPFMPEVRQNVEMHLTILAGNSEGHYFRENKRQDSLVKQNQTKLKELDAEIARWKQQQINSGHDPAAELPEHLKDRQIELMAKAEIYELEKQKLEKLLKEFEGKRIEETETRLLRGRLGKSKLSGGIVSEADGQICTVEKGLPTITDERSPYKGLPVHRYTSEVVVPVNAEWQHRINLEYKKARAEGRGVTKISRPKLPQFDAKSGKITYPNYSEKIINKFTS